MQRPSGGIVAALSILTLLTLSACKGEATDGKADAGAKSSDTQKSDGVEIPGDKTVPTEPGAEAGAASVGTPPADGGAAGAEAGAAEAGATSAGTVEPPAGPDPAVLLAMAANLDTDDATATSSLDDAVAAGAAKLDVAKVANTRGEALLTKGESDRAEPFFVWARDAHNLFAEPVFNLAKLAAYAGDLEVAKEHLQELEKRGNKKLLKKVGVEPAFTPLLDDPEVRKLFEQ
jgi:Flp pilus assembly protein TadD